MNTASRSVRIATISPREPAMPADASWSFVRRQEASTARTRDGEGEKVRLLFTRHVDIKRPTVLSACITRIKRNSLQALLSSSSDLFANSVARPLIIPFKIFSCPSGLFERRIVQDFLRRRKNLCTSRGAASSFGVLRAQAARRAHTLSFHGCSGFSWASDLRRSFL